MITCTDQPSVGVKKNTHPNRDIRMTKAEASSSNGSLTNDDYEQQTVRYTSQEQDEKIAEE
jgi:hypothetical protein